LDKLKVLYLCSYPPRECGIATFSKDLIRAIDKKFNPTLKSEVLAVNDNGSSIYNYGKKVGCNMDEDDLEQYIEVAESVNKNENIKLVSIQHEFGIFGGERGEFLISFLEKLDKPVVVTLHSVIPRPDKKTLSVLKAIDKRSSAIVVMAEKAVNILNKVYEIDTNKIYVVHHGVPSVPYLYDRSKIKEQLGLKNKTILSTFGLINRGKGIEYAIKALPKLVKKYPDLLYLVIGETHPKVRKEEGEEYRSKLIRLVKTLGLRNHVRFYNRYLTLNEIVDYLKATDIYIYPALDANQIVSGTLAYAMSAGKAIVATPSIYAKEMLAKKRGMVVKLKNVKSMRDSMDKLLGNNELRKSYEKNAYDFSRKMIWPNVAANYLEVFKKVIDVNEKIGMYKMPKIPNSC